MIKVALTNEILKRISVIDQNRFSVGNMELPAMTRNRLRKNSKKKSSYASNKIEGNPLTETQAGEAIESDPHKHFLRPEQEIRNYYLALDYLEKKMEKKEPFSVKMILEVQALVEKGASREKIGLRGAMPPGVLFAVYDGQSGQAEYIPPEYSEVPGLLRELEEYVNTTDDHPLIVAGVVHYQLVTIHPFEDGNGRTARLMSGYVMDVGGYGFGGIGSLEEYFAYEPEEYYGSLQMGLPALYYAGRDNPPHPEIWIHYFLRMVELYSKRVFELSRETSEQGVQASVSYLKKGEKELLQELLRHQIWEFAPIDLTRSLQVTNKTVINRCARLASNGLLIPVIVKARIRTYQVSEYARKNRKELLNLLESGK